MNFPFVVPSYVTFTILFSLSLRIYYSVRKDQRPNKKKLGYIYMVLTTIFLGIDFTNYQYVFNSDNFEKDFPYYVKLEMEQQQFYSNCIVTLGPLGRIACPKIFNNMPTLKVPTKINFNERLSKCHFDAPSWEPTTFEEVEHGSICNDALDEIEEKGTYREKLEIFNIILKSIKTLKTCEERFAYSRNLNHFQSLKNLIKKYRIDECLKKKCYHFCGAVSDSRGLLSSTKDLKHDFAFFNGEKYFGETLINKLISNILKAYSRGESSLNLEKLRFHYIDYLLAYYEAGKLDHLLSLVERSLNAEIPIERKIFDINNLRNIGAIKKHKESLLKRGKIENDGKCTIQPTDIRQVIIDEDPIERCEKRIKATKGKGSRIRFPAKEMKLKWRCGKSYESKTIYVIGRWCPGGKDDLEYIYGSGPGVWTEHAWCGGCVKEVKVHAPELKQK